jgi:hypothetical protein
MIILGHENPTPGHVSLKISYIEQTWNGQAKSHIINICPRVKKKLLEIFFSLKKCLKKQQQNIIKLLATEM